MMGLLRVDSRKNQSAAPQTRPAPVFVNAWVRHGGIGYRIALDLDSV